MNNKVLNLTFASSITNLCEINSSFDSGILRIAYAGANRNRTSISKETFEKCIKTIYNCPIVCNYDRETDTLGGHDVEIVKQKDGGMTIVNLTTPVGCIPESANVFWEEVEEDDGTKHEYLCAEALLWKRQEAYRKIKRDGVVAHSMEITVKDGESIDGLYHITDFAFTAFALIGVTPCFESSSIEVFSKKDFNTQFSEMMLELKESFNPVKPSDDEDDNTTKKYSMEGGEQVLDKNELITNDAYRGNVEKYSVYGIDIDSLGFSIEDFTAEELEEKFKAMQDVKPEGEPSAEPDNTPNDNTSNDDDGKFALMSNILDEVHRAIDEVQIQKEWGECNRYWFVDCDMDTQEIYCWDSNDWLLYGFTYALDGDVVKIDFESKKRKKYIIADFDEGEQPSPFNQVFAWLEQTVRNNTELEAKYQTASNTIEAMKTELDELREFKIVTEATAATNAREEVFSKFADLIGVEAFEALKETCADYDIETLEEKCFAIRGRLSVDTAKFAFEQKSPKLRVGHEPAEELPYGGLFEKYGFSMKN